MFNQLMEFF